MCGIAGRFSLGKLRELQTEDLLDSLNHRGPDSRGEWIDPDKTIQLLHNRLSILDLSDSGHQPMKSSSDRYIITFNGEIYNHIELKNKITKDNSFWKSNSDTESLLEYISSNNVKRRRRASIYPFKKLHTSSHQSHFELSCMFKILRDKLV